MKKFEILQELPKCDTETQSEPMLLEKWCWCNLLDSGLPQTFHLLKKNKTTIFVKCNKAQYTESPGTPNVNIPLYLLYHFVSYHLYWSRVRQRQYYSLICRYYSVVTSFPIKSFRTQENPRLCYSVAMSLYSALILNSNWVSLCAHDIGIFSQYWPLML